MSRMTGITRRNGGDAARRRPCPPCARGPRGGAAAREAERLQLLRTERWWVAHDQAQAALARLDALLRDGPGQIRPSNLLLAGATNNGKSWIVERFRRAHAVPPGEDAEHLPVVVMQMPTEPTVSRFYAALLTNIGALALRRAGRQTGIGTVDLARAARRWCEGADHRRAAQHACRHPHGRERVPEPAALARQRAARAACGCRHPRRMARDPHRPAAGERFEPFVLPSWRPGPEAVRLLQGFATLLPLRCPSDLRGTELVRGVIARTGGTIGEAAAAIQGGEERITAGVLDRATYLGPGERRLIVERELV